MTYGMSLRTLLEGWHPDVPDIPITGITADSRQIEPGFAFVAVQGQRTHGMQHAAEALEKGCAVILHDGRAAVAPTEVPLVRLDRLQERQAELASRFWAAPSEDMTIAAVTGTNGKTSVAHFMAQVWQQAFGKAGMIGTLGYGPLDRLEKASHTTPDPFTLNRVLANCVDDRIDHLAMEVSSHALAQGRCETVQIAAAIFTNLSRDHLDYHADMASYAAAKKRLFTDYAPRFAVINRDDPTGRGWIDEISGRTEVLSFGLEPGAELQAELLAQDSDGMALRLHSPWGDCEMRASLLGRFNASNLMAAAGALTLLGMPWPEAVRELEMIQPVPGRMVRLGGRLRQPVVVVDYAHTPDALANALLAMREHLSGRLVCVFGCGGNRDRGKRAAMGHVAETLADHLVVTTDNPRHESVNSIINDILAGLESNAAVRVQPDRAAAIVEAVSTSGPGDMVLIAGKGHENYQEVAGRRLPFSDEAVVRTALEAAA